MILLCYDGSDDAAAAIDAAGGLFAGEPATVLTVWEPFVNVMARTGAGLTLGGAEIDYEGIDAASRRAASERADDGAERARRAGLEAKPRVAAREGTIATTILAEAEAVGAQLVVVGTRGLSGLKSALLGSVSHAVLQDADRAVLVAPSSELASTRRARRP
jgi:nucleotide-binding universal stress UspA family protein